MAQILTKIKNKYKRSPDLGIAQTLKQKTKLVSWIASNCKYSNGAKTRMNIVNKMVESGIKMDLRGSCFPKNLPAPPRNDKDLLEFLGRSKFYLAFENSYHCKDESLQKRFFERIRSCCVGIEKRRLRSCSAEAQFYFPRRLCVEFHKVEYLLTLS